METTSTAIDPVVQSIAESKNLIDEAVKLLQDKNLLNPCLVYNAYRIVSKFNPDQKHLESKLDILEQLKEIHQLFDEIIATPETIDMEKLSQSVMKLNFTSDFAYKMERRASSLESRNFWNDYDERHLRK